MSYIVKGIDPEPYRSLFGLADEELASRGIVRMTVTDPFFPLPCQSYRPGRG